MKTTINTTIFAFTLCTIQSLCLFGAEHNSVLIERISDDETAISWPTQKAGAKSHTKGSNKVAPLDRTIGALILTDLEIATEGATEEEIPDDRERPSTRSSAITSTLEYVKNYCIKAGANTKKDNLKHKVLITFKEITYDARLEQQEIKTQNGGRLYQRRIWVKPSSKDMPEQNLKFFLESEWKNGNDKVIIRYIAPSCAKQTCCCVARCLLCICGCS